MAWCYTGDMPLTDSYVDIIGNSVAQIGNWIYKLKGDENAFKVVLIMSNGLFFNCKYYQSL